MGNARSTEGVLDERQRSSFTHVKLTCGPQQATWGPMWGDSTEKRLTLGIFLMDKSNGPGRDRGENGFHGEGKTHRKT